MKTLRRLEELVLAGLVQRGSLPALRRVAAQYDVAITPDMAGLMNPKDVADPIARQFVPSAAEAVLSAEERADPIGDDVHAPLPGIVHRYPDRVLLKPAHVCPVYCRFCFRREVVGGAGAGTLSEAALTAALDYVRDRPALWEVIVTGGDPLVLSPRRLARIVAALAAMEHIKVVRFHTRVPVVQPTVVDTTLVRALRAEGIATYVVLHANHIRELTPRARAACARLVDAGIPLLSQTVLLRGVNDDAESLAALLRGFVESRVKPYYLHHPDLAKGTGHFRLTLEAGRALVKHLQGRLSGVCQPTYVLDIPGGHGKVPVGPDFATPLARGGWAVEDRNGCYHTYPPASRTWAEREPSNGEREFS